MKTYPIRVPRDSYSGRVDRRVAKRTEYNRVAARIETYLNEKLKHAPDNRFQQFFSANISSDLGEDSDLVHRIVYSIDCGSNGLTVCKGDYELANNSSRFR